jgi:hypothetical protein
VLEQPPRTAAIVKRPATRAKVRRFIYLSSLWIMEKIAGIKSTLRLNSGRADHDCDNRALRAALHAGRMATDRPSDVHPAESFMQWHPQRR